MEETTLPQISMVAVDFEFHVQKHSHVRFFYTTYIASYFNRQNKFIFTIILPLTKQYILIIFFCFLRKEPSASSTKNILINHFFFYLDKYFSTIFHHKIMMEIFFKLKKKNMISSTKIDRPYTTDLP